MAFLDRDAETTGATGPVMAVLAVRRGLDLLGRLMGCTRVVRRTAEALQLREACASRPVYDGVVGSRAR
jgi:hypothetical protein